MAKFTFGGASLVVLAGLACAATPAFAQTSTDAQQNTQDTQNTQHATPHRHHHAISGTARENRNEDRETARLNEEQLDQAGQTNMAQNAPSAPNSGNPNMAAPQASAPGAPDYGTMNPNMTTAPAGAPGTDNPQGSDTGANAADQTPTSYSGQPNGDNGVYYNNGSSEQHGASGTINYNTSSCIPDSGGANCGTNAPQSNATVNGGVNPSGGPQPQPPQQ
jgi:hypothetical protein